MKLLNYRKRLNYKASVSLFGDPDFNEPRTYIIFGAPRGGTSMVAGTARGLGLNIGEDIPINNEDPMFLGSLSINELKSNIQIRNENLTTWGWKYPRASDYLEDVIESVRNPYFIVVYRDIVTMVNRRMIGLSQQNLLNHNVDIHKLFQDEISLQQKNLTLINKFRRPTKLFSYEKCIINPNEFMYDIGKFLGVEKIRKKRKIIRYIKPGKYKYSDHLDKINDLIT